MKPKTSHKKGPTGCSNLFISEFGKQNNFVLILKGSNSKISWNIFVSIIVFEHVVIEIEEYCLKDTDPSLNKIEM